MSRMIFTLAFVLGAIAVIGMCAVFVGSDSLALAITLVIGAVYTIGTVELLQFQKASRTLSQALSNVPEQINNLDDWLASLHPSLKNAVRLRIEGEKAGLPAPVLTPYLVGLLVMLGLLGTFVGMVDTLQGAVTALEGSNELSAIREGLAAPIKGLGLAFGTSVAGVAASAMLGLMSTISRRDRVMATRILDARITTVFRDFSLTHNRQETYKALQMQASALPSVVEQLQCMAEKLENMGDKLSEQLNSKQENFHASVKGAYEGLAQSVAEALKTSLTDLNSGLSESGRLAGESIKPVVEQTMTELSLLVSQHTDNTHKLLTERSDQQLEALSDSFSQTTEAVTQAWKNGVAAHDQSHQAMSAGLNQTLNGFTGEFEKLAQGLATSFTDHSTQWNNQLAGTEKQRLQRWTEAFEQAQTIANSKLAETSDLLGETLGSVIENQKAAFDDAIQRFAAASSSLTAEWQQSGHSMLGHQQRLTESFENTGQLINEQTKQVSEKLLGELTRLFETSENLVESRITAEAEWTEGHGERIKQLTETVGSELKALREQEARRSDVAVQHFTDLEATLATQLAVLGQALEAPMARLIDTASEAPRAAAEVIAQLRQEITNNLERDNGLLEDRQRIMQDLDGLSASLAQTSSGQREAVEKLVQTSTQMLENISIRFDEHVGSEVSKLSDIAAHFSSSATEISSLGEAFGLAVALFNESNDKLVDNLSRIETAMANATERSDEQLAYYITQARDVIDHSMMSQKAVFDELRAMSIQNASPQNPVSQSLALESEPG